MTESTEIIRRFHAGDSSVFERLVEAYQEDIYTLCLRTCGDVLIAENKAEAVFTQAHRSLFRVAPSTPLREWFIGITIANLADFETIDSVDNPPEDPESVVVNRVLSELDLPFRFAVILRDVLRLEETEVATILNLPLGTVRSRIHRGRLTMARSLAKEMEA